MNGVLPGIDPRKVFIHGGITIVVVFTLCIGIYPIFSRLYAKLDFLYDNNIKNIIISDSFSKKERTYIYSTPRIYIYKDKQASMPIVVESFMQIENHDEFDNLQLQRNEIALSKNTAKKYRLNIGDFLYLLAGYKDSPEAYKITEIFDTTYGIVEEDPMLDCGVAIIGYDAEFETRLTVKYVTFTNKSLEALPNVLLLRLCKLITGQELKFEFYARLTLAYCVFFILVWINYILIANCLQENNGKNLLFLFRIGLSNRKIALAAVALSCLLFLFPLSLGVGLYLLLIGRHLINAHAVISLMMLSLIYCLFWIFIILRKCWLSGRFIKWRK